MFAGFFVSVFAYDKYGVWCERIRVKTFVTLDSIFRFHK